MKNTRTESDSMGAMEVPSGALYAAQTARAVENFPISGWPLPAELIAAIGLIKQAAATSHKAAGRIDTKTADAIIAAAGEVAEGRLNEHFPIDVFQTGSATSTNMNANEVIANRAIQILGGDITAKPKRVHPNDHVNMGQSSNDVIPSAIHVAAAVAIRRSLIPALESLAKALSSKAAEFDTVVKIGRTHLMDAVPICLGQEFSGYDAQVRFAIDALDHSVDALAELAIGGTAVGTGLNAPKGFATDVCRIISEKTQFEFSEASNHFAAQAGKDAVVFASGAVRTAAVALGKIASDIRLMGSGPRCGLGELKLPATQPGSSIMPGKVNPVICESLIQVVCQVIGCDAAVTAAAMGGVGGILELNVAMPVMAMNLLTSIRLLASAAGVFETKCIAGLVANESRCRESIEQSLAMATVLAPKIGYDAAAEIAKAANESQKTIRQICLERELFTQAQLDELLDARGQTGN